MIVSLPGGRAIQALPARARARVPAHAWRNISGTGTGDLIVPLGTGSLYGFGYTRKSSAASLIYVYDMSLFGSAEGMAVNTWLNDYGDTFQPTGGYFHNASVRYPAWVGTIP
jgi:hypothetical protein